jgi:hypothetical protein
MTQRSHDGSETMGPRMRRRQQRRRVALAGVGAGLLLAATGVAQIGGAGPAGATTTFSTTTCGTVTTTVVPAGVFSMTIEAQGGAGGSVAMPGFANFVGGGAGSLVKATAAVTPGQSISVVAGCDGARGTDFGNNGDGPGRGGPPRSCAMERPADLARHARQSWRSLPEVAELAARIASPLSVAGEETQVSVTTR